MTDYRNHGLSKGFLSLYVSSLDYGQYRLLTDLEGRSGVVCYESIKEELKITNYMTILFLPQKIFILNSIFKKQTITLNFPCYTVS